MKCSIIVGGQYGSEGKGKALTAILKKTHDPCPALVRCGGPNAGHTHLIKGRDIIFRQVPASDHPGAQMFLAAGSVINPIVLQNELELLDWPALIVDHRAVLIDENSFAEEHNLVSSIGSTGSGTGAALVKRMMRLDVTLADTLLDIIDAPNLIVDVVAPYLHDKLNNGGHVIIEGTQGFGLSILHGEYPFCTAKDTTACAFASEAGIPVRQIDDVVVVIRAFPIRVGGNSGPLKNEITWEEVAKIGGAPEVEYEYTSVTKRLRRVALFDMDMVKWACKVNGATRLALMGIDRLDYQNRGIKDFDSLTPKAKDFIRSIEDATQTPVQWVGTSPKSDDLIDRLP